MKTRVMPIIFRHNAYPVLTAKVAGQIGEDRQYINTARRRNTELENE